MYLGQTTSTTPDEQDEFCSGCGARNVGNPCQQCRQRPGGA